MATDEGWPLNPAWIGAILGVLLVAINELVQRYLVPFFQEQFTPIVFVRTGDQGLALRVVEIIAVLLPLVAIFVQILFRRADNEQSPLHDSVDLLLGPLVLTFIGLFIAVFLAIVVAMLGGIGLLTGAALVALLVGFIFILVLVLMFVAMVEEEYGVEGQQQLLGAWGTDSDQGDGEDQP